MKAVITKSCTKFSDNHFASRSDKKNALAISSQQSRPVNSYEDVKNEYTSILNSENLYKRPSYWGGYSFTPYYFEFWKGHKSRINKREIYKLVGDEWMKSFLSP